jgi:hypothetical protein
MLTIADFGSVKEGKNHAMSIDEEMRRHFPLVLHFPANIPCKHLDGKSGFWTETLM